MCHFVLVLTISVNAKPNGVPSQEGFPFHLSHSDLFHSAFVAISDPFISGMNQVDLQMGFEMVLCL